MIKMHLKTIMVVVYDLAWHSLGRQRWRNPRRWLARSSRRTEAMCSSALPRLLASCWSRAETSIVFCIRHQRVQFVSCSKFSCQEVVTHMFDHNGKTIYEHVNEQNKTALCYSVRTRCTYRAQLPRLPYRASVNYMYYDVCFSTTESNSLICKLS